MRTNSRLDVYAGRSLAGVIARSQVEEDAYLFDYTDECPPDDAVSLTMPVVRDQYDSMNGLLPIFEMNLPEGALLERLRTQFSKIIPFFDNLDLLAIVGQSQIGRLQYSAPSRAPKPMPEHSIAEILTYIGAEDLFVDLLQKYAEHSGVSGVQPKVLVRDEQVPLPRLSHRAATHIVKSFDPREYPELAANEYFCTRAAQHAGIPVPNMQLSENRRILVTERFDLTPDGGYLGCEDFCVLNGLRAHGRYTGSYEGIAERIAQFVDLENQRAALEQFFATVVLSCAIGNGDAHLKNFAVVYESPEKPVSLAPSYDLVSTRLYQARDVLALTLGNSKTFPDRQRLVKFAFAACDLTRSQIADIFNRVQGGIHRAIVDVQRFSKEHADFASTATKLISLFESGAARVAES